MYESYKCVGDTLFLMGCFMFRLWNRAVLHITVTPVCSNNNIQNKVGVDVWMLSLIFVHPDSGTIFCLNMGKV